MLSPATGLEDNMYRQFGNSAYRTGFVEHARGDFTLGKSGQLEALIALERIGTRVSFARNDEIYAEGDDSDYWCKVVSGTVRICKLLADGRRHIAEFCFSGDCFGIDNASERVYAAEAVDDVIVMRFRRSATEQLIDQNPMVARILRDATLRDLASAHTRTLLLGRMTAPERVAAFLLEMFERRERTKALDLPMSRIDMADSLGLTVETVCRTLSIFRRDGMIAVPNPHRIELLDRPALEEIGEPQ
jgi:CRP/FNR family transcriptional regulator, nitrogen fixation regulation protein